MRSSKAPATSSRRSSAEALVEKASGAIQSALTKAKELAGQRRTSDARPSSTNDRSSQESCHASDADVEDAFGPVRYLEEPSHDRAPRNREPVDAEVVAPPSNQAVLRKVDAERCVSPQSDPHNIRLFEESLALDKYKLKSILIFFDQMKSHPAQRPLQLDLVKTLLESCKAVGIDRRMDHGRVAVVIEGVKNPSELPTAFKRLAHTQKAQIIGGRHRWEAGLPYKKFLAETARQPPGVPFGTDIGWWTYDVYSNEISSDEMALHTKMHVLNEGANPTEKTDAQRMILIMKFIHHPNAEEFPSASLKNAPLVRALKSPAIPQLLETLLIHRAFSALATFKFVEKLAMHKVFALAELVLLEFIQWHQQLRRCPRAPSGVLPGSLKFFKKYGLLTRGYWWPSQDGEDGYDSRALAKEMNVVSPTFRASSSELLLVDSYLAKDAIYAPTLLTAPLFMLCALYGSCRDVIDGTVHFLIGDFEYSSMSSRAQTKSALPHLSLDVKGLSNIDPSKVPTLCDAASAHETILGETDELILKIYRYLCKNNRVSVLSAQLHENDAVKERRIIMKGTKAKLIKELFVESSDWHAFLCLIPTSGFYEGRRAFAYGVGVVHPSETPTETNAERLTRIESFPATRQGGRPARFDAYGVSLSPSHEATSHCGEGQEQIQEDFGEAGGEKRSKEKGNSRERVVTDSE